MAIPIGEYEPFWLDTAGGKGILFLGDYLVPTGCMSMTALRRRSIADRNIILLCNQFHEC
ncbi:hypothetical protein BLOT_004643 [Blomia tropicalis]|nr:hypothetical protein BLOT_004643 [Blomia tropicalis]